MINKFILKFLEGAKLDCLRYSSHLTMRYRVLLKKKKKIYIYIYIYKPDETSNINYTPF